MKLFPGSFLVAGALLLHPSPAALGQISTPGTVWAYQLLEGSTIVDDCPVCDRIPIIMPLRGSLELRCLQNGPLFSYYAFENINLTTVGTSGAHYKVTGSGSFQIGGEAALRQTLSLELWIDDGITNKPCFFTNVSSEVTRLWPMIQVSVTQTNGTYTQQFSLDLNAAPFREIWFSTAGDFVAGIWNSPTNVVSDGDFLSSIGRKVKANYELSYHLGIMPVVPDLGLKDVDILPGGEIAFSIELEMFSESLGRTLGKGDLLSNRGYIIRTNADLIAAFNPQSLPAQGVGLAGVQIMSPDVVWFSVQNSFYSQARQTLITPGDLLSEKGEIIRSNAELLSRFSPIALTNPIPLKAIYVWPHREIWFCLGAAFDGPGGAHYASGDLLSDQGYVVFRNSELLQRFAPVAPGNLAVDALYFVTDVLANSSSVSMAVPRITNQPPASVVLSWQGEGRVFQLESSTNSVGPFLPALPIAPDSLAIDARALLQSPAKFYRVHQW